MYIQVFQNNESSNSIHPNMGCCSIFKGELHSNSSHSLNEGLNNMNVHV